MTNLCYTGYFNFFHSFPFWCSIWLVSGYPVPTTNGASHPIGQNFQKSGPLRGENKR